MALWHESTFFMNFKNHIVKWYQTVLLPVFHIDNSGKKQLFNNEGEEPKTKEEDNVTAVLDNGSSPKEKTVTVSMPGMNKKGPVASGDAQAVLDRINNDRDGRYSDEIEKARKEAEEARRKKEEEERLASIMNANKVDVDSFIAQGKSAAEEAKEAEDARRAQEIMDRLNREAAEDEAKKAAEIEEAKRQAAEKQNLTAANNGGDDAAAKAAEDARRAQEIIDRLNREAAEDEAKKQAELEAAMAEAAQKFGN